MARASLQIVRILQATAQKLEKSNIYQWGHMGSCNCGFLAQEITSLKKDQIHARAMERYGDWNEQLNDYCPTSGLLMDDLITEMLNTGFDTNDLRHLEKLSDPLILRAIPGRKTLRHNCKEDVVCYLRAWADILEDKLVVAIKLPAISQPARVEI